MDVGVLALQGCIEPHAVMLKQLGAGVRYVRQPAELAGLDNIILPGGESTTMLKLLEISGLFGALRDFAQKRPVWGVCAGAILLAKEVLNPAQKSLGLVPVRAQRNYYGCQLDSFKAVVRTSILNREIPVDFIRAPLLEPLTREVLVLGRYQDQAVLMRHDRILLSAFHSELGSDLGLHEYFLSL
jgi:pyridoxal 5'-phosphate synthase pdxT subunit